jgi:hypothetical protein
VSRCNRCQWRHDPEADQPGREQLADHARDSGHWLCSCCFTSLAPEDQGTCETCLTSARELLSGIMLMFDELGGHLGHARGQAYDQNRTSGSGKPLPGGDVLTLLAGGSAGGAPRRLTALEAVQPERWWIRGGIGPLTQAGLMQAERERTGREHQIDNLPTDAPSVAFELWTVAEDWRGCRLDAGLDPGTGFTAARPHTVAGYLEVHTRWAAREHPAFAEYFTDLERLHARLEGATGRRRAPAKANAKCFDCRDADLVRRVDRTTGLEEDHVTCRRCRRQYTASEYALALRATVETGLQGWVPINEAAAKSRRSVETLESWAKRLLVNVACRLSDKRKVVWWPDIEQRATKAQKRKAS